MRFFSDRWWLKMKATIWGCLRRIGMVVHLHGPPQPPQPSFVIKVPSRISSKPGSFRLVFYVPKEYHSAPNEQKFPVVVNYHGGGFVLGTGTDDCPWANSVVKTKNAVF